MKRIIRLMSNTTNPDTFTREELENMLYEMKNDKPAKFLKIATDKHLELKSEIEEMVSLEIGNQVIYIDEILGETLNDAVIQLKDKKNSGKLMELRAKLKEAKI